MKQLQEKDRAMLFWFPEKNTTTEELKTIYKQESLQADRVAQFEVNAV